VYLSYVDTDLLYLYKRLNVKCPNRVNLLDELVFYSIDGNISGEEIDYLCEFELNYLPDLFNMILPTEVMDDGFNDFVTYRLKPKALIKVKRILELSRKWKMEEKLKFQGLLKDSYENLCNLSNLSRGINIYSFNDRKGVSPYSKSRLCNYIEICFYEYFEVTSLAYVLRLLLNYSDGLEKAARYGKKINMKYREDELNGKKRYCGRNKTDSYSRN